MFLFSSRDRIGYSESGNEIFHIEGKKRLFQPFLFGFSGKV
ncbi:hypothetical protein STRDD10_00888 [Streptococcus sp. DD10]|nr:hypothetical protein STRDD10_00888 [Streptococcus sp. DD10]